MPTEAPVLCSAQQLSTAGSRLRLPCLWLGRSPDYWGAATIGPSPANQEMLILRARCDVKALSASFSLGAAMAACCSARVGDNGLPDSAQSTKRGSAYVLLSTYSMAVTASRCIAGVTWE